ncbi:hypothetical protein [Streptomyces sp. NPDC001380]|uniref:hypothetical protein n=1 Tax=Streptomyces sp. NPDC001380 TaxID=3364566 RepID=UPI0036A5157B
MSTEPNEKPALLRQRDSATIQPVQELDPEISVYRHMVYGSGLTDPLDFLILIHLLFMTKDGEIITVAKLIARLQSEGIRNGNGKGKGLVGRDAVYASIKRLMAAGFLSRLEQESDGGSFKAVGYTFRKFPAANPAWTPEPDPYRPERESEKPQVRARAVTTHAVPASNRVSAAQDACGDNGHADNGHAHTARGKRRVSAAQHACGDNAYGSVSPPHPPEEGGTPSSPNPHTTGGVGGYTPEQLDEAVQFLMRLPGKWGLGLRRAKNLASVLLANAAETGWDLDGSLRMWLCRHEESKPLPTNYAATLEYRIKDLQLRSVAMATEDDNPQQAQKPSPAGRVPAWCGECNHGEQPRTLLERTVDVPGDDDAAAPCPRCHPAALAKARSTS